MAPDGAGDLWAVPSISAPARQQADLKRTEPKLLTQPSRFPPENHPVRNFPQLRYRQSKPLQLKYQQLFYFAPGGSNSVVECQLPMLNVAGSIPVSRSNLNHLEPLISLADMMIFAFSSKMLTY